MQLLRAQLALNHWTQYFNFFPASLLITLQTPTAATSAQARYQAVKSLKKLQKQSGVQIQTATGIYRHHHALGCRYVRLLLNVPEHAISDLLYLEEYNITRIINRKRADQALALGIGCSSDRSDIVTIHQYDLVTTPAASIHAPAEPQRLI